MNRDADAAHNLLGTNSHGPSYNPDHSDSSSSEFFEAFDAIVDAEICPKSQAAIKADKPNPFVERKNKLMAELMTYYRDMIHTATQQIPANASNSSAAINSLAMETAMTGFVCLQYLALAPQNHVLTVKQIRATEDLLSLTHEIRELWIIGPLTKPGDGDEEARRNMKQEAEETFNLVNALRNEQRLAQIGAAEQSPMRYHVKNLEGHPGRTQAGQVPGVYQ